MEIVYFLFLFVGTVFFVYGVVSFFSDLVKKGRCRGDIPYAPKLVLEVRNSEECIEGILRKMIALNLPYEICTDGKIYVLDRGSSDATKQIVEKLSFTYPYIKLIEGDK